MFKNTQIKSDFYVNIVTGNYFSVKMVMENYL